MAGSRIVLSTLRCAPDEAAPAEGTTGGVPRPGIRVETELRDSRLSGLGRKARASRGGGMRMIQTPLILDSQVVGQREGWSCTMLTPGFSRLFHVPRSNCA